jgi:hypothetical protein
LKEAKKILLVTRKNPDFDTYLSLQLLAEVIKQDLQKKVEFASESELPKNFQEAVPFPDIKKMTTLPPKSFILEFKNQDNKVRNIQWNQNQDKISLYVTMEQGNLNPQNLDVQITGADYDLIILVGVNSLEELGNLYLGSKLLFEETRMTVLSRKAVIKLPQAKVTDGSRVASISELIFNYLEGNGVKLSPERATRILAGIFSATENFRKNLIDARTYESAAKLTRLGATNDTASALSGRGKPAGESGKTQQQPQGQRPAENRPSTQPQGPEGAKQARNASFSDAGGTAPRQATPAERAPENSQSYRN